MTLLPVIERELRAESRGAFTYWLRFGGAGVLLVVTVLWFMNEGRSLATGEDLFRSLHIGLFLCIWLAAAMMTADAISRERREGTLGLLFLTPLRPFAVVLAKGLAHGIRTAAVALAAVPVLVLPFLMGGVGWREALASVLVNFTALCWALAAGLLASSLCKTMTRALVLAAILEAGALFLMVVMHGAALMTVTAAAGSPARRMLNDEFEEVLIHGLYALSAPNLVFSWAAGGGGFPGPISVNWLATLGTIAAGSLLVCLLAVALAGQIVRRAARDRDRSVVLQKMERGFCTPTFALGFYRRWMRRVLERNPVGWLERRTWQARLVTWSWLAVMMVVLSWFVAQRISLTSEFSEPLLLLGWALAGNVALTAAGSLRRERESGVIELLLVSPLTVRQIIRGRLRGIAGQFLPAAALLFGTWLWLLYSFSWMFSGTNTVPEQLARIWLLLVTLAAVPVAGLYFSLRCRVFAVAVFFTFGIIMALPWLASAGLWWLCHTEWAANLPPAWRAEVGGVMVFGAALATVFGRRTWALVLGTAGAAAFASYVFDDLRLGDKRLLPFVAVCTVLQAGTAFLLAGLLRRRIERRDFALPQ